MESFKHICSRCRNLKLVTGDFDINLKTNEYYKSCRKCREDDQQRKISKSDEIKAYHKKHYQETKEKQNAKTKQWRENNKDKFNEIFECECGSKCLRRMKNRHEQSKKHLAYLEKLNNRKCLYCGDIFCDDVINPKTNKLYETCEKHRGLPKEIKEALNNERKEHDDKIKRQNHQRMVDEYYDEFFENLLNNPCMGRD